MSSFGWIGSRPNVNRISKTTDLRHDIVNYGWDNLYPQEMNLIHLRSPLIKQSVNVLADFYLGNGFEQNAEVVVNEEGETINDVLRFACHDVANYGGFALMLNLNGLGMPETIENIPYEFIRFGLPDALGKHSDVKISNNWQQASRELPQGSVLEPVTFPIYNPFTASEQAIAGNGSQVLYFTGNNRNEYSLVSYDAITNAGQTDADIQQYQLNSVANSFKGLTLFRYPGQFESEREKEELYAAIRESTGVGGNGIFVVEADEDIGTILEGVPSSETADLYLNTVTTVQNMVTQNYAMPPVLLGISAGGSVFNEQALIDGYVIFNTSTKNMRDTIGRIFDSLGDFGAIVPRSILLAETMGEEEEEEEVIEEEEETAEEGTEETPEEEEAA